jgi:hypothetical protein
VDAVRTFGDVEDSGDVHGGEFSCGWGLIWLGR